MEFGLNFFPTVGPTEKSAYQYYDECLRLAVLAEQLGFEHVKTVEHYFHPYGGYSPDPVTLLAAVAAVTSRIRLVTGAVIPAFSHPVKLAGKLAMLDNLSHGRLDVGFGRAFLPEEFSAFGVSMDESRARFGEGVEACRRLWSEENVIWKGDFYTFGPVTLLPRPYQQPTPRIMVASAVSPESCEAAGRDGNHLLLVPSISGREHVQDMLARYHKAWADYGHGPGTEHIQLSYTCYIAEDQKEAWDNGRLCFNNYMSKLADAVTSWRHTSSGQYPGYERLVEQIASNNFDRSVNETKILVGTPAEVRDQVAQIHEWYGDVALSLQVNSGNMRLEESERTIRLFAERVIPELGP
jgi:alkanesulfonate monooxygenase SsuD/methylene tetrahydromethanopterin reductase-like flavin-dependent oxidoreductase (luciferase family)